MLSLTFFTGAGISVEAGLPTFRDSSDLSVDSTTEILATKKNWESSPEQVLDFYNKRRHQALSVEPTDAHHLIKQLEAYYKVNVITQNIDDLHERANSNSVTHLHGEIMKAQCSGFSEHVIECKKDISTNCQSIYGYQLRPNVVLFDEPVLNISKARDICSRTDIFIILGTSLNVQPASLLYQCLPTHAKIYYIDPNPTIFPAKAKIIKEKAYKGIWCVLNDLVLYER